MKTISSLVLSAVVLLVACGGGANPNANRDTQDKGSIKMGVDENYKFLAESLVLTFTGLKPDAKIANTYLQEGDAFKALLDDSVRIIMVNRELSPAEKEIFRKRELTPKTVEIAKDAIAFIVNKNNTDTAMSLGMLKAMFTGNASKWADINPANKAGDMVVAFDNTSSSNARFLMEKFELKQFPPYCMAAKSNPDVVKYVEENPNAIGVIGVNWISDREDTSASKFLKNVNVVWVSPNNDMKVDTAKAVPPHYYYNINGEYPFTRIVYLIRNEPYSGLGTGFASFCFNQKGQQVVRLNGLAPINLKMRVINLKSE